MSHLSPVDQLQTHGDSEDYIQTLGVNFMEKTISIRNTEITFSVCFEPVADHRSQNAS